MEDIKRIKRQIRDRLNKCSDMPTLRKTAVALGHRPPGWPYSTPLLPIPTRGKLYTIEEFTKSLLQLVWRPSGKAYFACLMWMSNVEVNLSWIRNNSYEDLPKGFTHIVWFGKGEPNV
jgi:hypothetical protein